MGRYFVLVLTYVCFLFVSLPASLDARDSYENYRGERDRYIAKDKPLSEVRSGEKEDVLDDIRSAVRDEIDLTISRERKAKKKKINESKLIEDVRVIVREEIEDALNIRKKKYLKKGTFEIGGFVSFQSKGLDADEEDNNYRLRLFPTMAYFLGTNIALNLKGEADINLSQDTKSYNIGFGPQFVYGLSSDDDICFFATIFGGVSVISSEGDQTLGYRYGNELGLKFILTSGVILNAGVMIIFDNGGENVEGFQNVLVPTVGITAWF